MRLFLIGLPLFLCQCGYNWGHETRKLPEGLKTVFVEIFENTTSEPGIEHFFTQAMKNELQRSGFALVSSRDAAELVLKGSIIQLNINGGASKRGFFQRDYSSPNPANRTSTLYNASFFTEFNIQVKANLKALRSRDKQVVWQTMVNGNGNYKGAFLKQQGIRSSNVLYNNSRKKQTMQLVAQQMMTEAFDQMTESF